MHDDAPSKTQQKKAMHALQALGAALVELSEAQLAAFALPDALRQAVREAQRITRREARRRQLQYIGRLMREVDAEPIRARLEALRGHSAAAIARQRVLEQWRTRLLEDDGALTEFAREHPGADLQALRNALRNARRELAAARPPRGYREVFRLIRDATGEHEGGSDTTSLSPFTDPR